jgi:hypothetical protein
MPVRLQRKRTKGYRLPPNAVYVGRPTVWGNIWRPEDAAAWYPGQLTKRQQVEWAVAQYRRDAEQRQFVHYDLSDADAVPLTDLPARMGGRDLVCWCPLDQPCHADVLLAWANPQAALREAGESS